MRNLLLVLLAFFAIAEVCVAQKLDPPKNLQVAKKLDPPKNLQVAKLSPPTVILGWEWTTADVPLEKVKFRIAEVTDQIPTVSANGTLRAELDNLIAGREYNVTIVAYLDDSSLEDSDPLSGLFSTLTKDWPAPTDATFSAGKRELNQIIYNVSWKFDSSDALSKNPTRFTIECEEPSCDEKPVDGDKRDATIPLSYYTDYTVAISAFYALPMGLNQTRKDKQTFKTAPGTPGPIANVQVKQAPDTLNLNITWSAPEKPNGDIESYTVQLLASPDKTQIFEREEKSTQLSYQIPLDKPIVDAYIVRIRAINNADPEFKNGSFTDFGFDLQKPEPPQKVDFTERTATSFKVDIQRTTDNDKLYFRITTPQGNDTRLEPGSKSVTLDGFTPFTTVTLKIASCLPLKDKTELCGEEKPFETITNVDAPSEVQKLDVVYPDGKAKLTWQAPAVPAGPIDGYLVQFFNGTDKPSEDAKDIGNVLEFAPKDVVNCTEYKFTIRAFNNDLVTQDKRIGKPTTKTLPGCGSPPKGFPTWATVLIVFIVLGAAGGAVFYFLRVRQ